MTGILVYHFFVMLYISKLGGVGQEKNLKDCWVGPGKFIDVDRVGKNFFLDFGSFSSVPPPAINNDQSLMTQYELITIEYVNNLNHISIWTGRTKNYLGGEGGGRRVCIMFT